MLALFVKPCKMKCTELTTNCFLWPFLGGFDGFFALYPELCFSPPVMCSNHPALYDSEPIVSGRKTPLYDQVSYVKSQNHYELSNYIYMSMSFEYTHSVLFFVISRVVQLKSSPSSFWAVRFTPPDGRLWSDAGSRLCSMYPLPVPICLRRNFSTKLWRWRTIWPQTYASSFQTPSTLLVSLYKN